MIIMQVLGEQRDVSGGIIVSGFSRASTVSTRRSGRIPLRRIPSTSNKEMSIWNTKIFVFINGGVLP
jgi:hypothetical protein